MTDESPADAADAGAKRQRDETEESKSSQNDAGIEAEDPPTKKTKSVDPTESQSQSASQQTATEESAPEGPNKGSVSSDVAEPPGTQKKAEAQVGSQPITKAPPSPKSAGNPSGVPSAADPVDPTVAATVTNPNSIVEERGEISAQYVGKVIGKGGEMLRDLQARSGCRLDVDQNVPHGNPRILTYRGTRKTVDLAKQMVQVLCTPQGNEGSLPLGEATRKDLIVPASSVGKIIGRAGEMVRELQSRSQAKIQVDHTNKAIRSDSRSVSIIGTPDAVTKAEEMILFLVANPMLDAMKAIRMLVEDKMHKGGRWGSGSPYMNMPNQGQNMQPTEQGGYSHNPPQQQQQYGSYHQGGPPPGHGYGGHGGPPPPNQQPYDPYYSNRGPETEIFPAAKMYMGRIIGQKGVTINDLQKRSGCDIQINQDVPPGQDCIITIKGTRQGIESAKQMLREIIEMGPNHSYAGGGGQYQGQNNHGYQQQQPAPYVQQPPMPSGYQPHGQQMYGHQQQQYGHQPPPHQYGPPQMNYGMPQYQSTGYQQEGTPGYGGPPQRQQPPMGGPTPAWKSATAADGQVYYYNEKTGETTWNKPPGLP